MRVTVIRDDQTRFDVPEVRGIATLEVDDSGLSTAATIAVGFEFDRTDIESHFSEGDSVWCVLSADDRGRYDPYEMSTKMTTSSSTETVPALVDRAYGDALKVVIDKIPKENHVIDIIESDHTIHWDQ